VLAECDPTQLYVSVDAADRKTFRETVHAVEDDAWDRLVDTMDVLADKDETRTVLRTTVLKGYNDHHPEWYAGMYDRADADFVELKAYMHVGHSRGRLDRSAMPEHEEVREFTEAVQGYLPTHPVLREVEASRVALLAREEDTWVPELKGGSEFWSEEPYDASAD
jgi:tRNA wybutosine-synthesizing protein 1